MSDFLKLKGKMNEWTFFPSKWTYEVSRWNSSTYNQNDVF
jgi:hypothetical protein